MKQLGKMLGAVVLAITFFAVLGLVQLGWNLLANEDNATPSNQTNNHIIIPSQTPRGTVPTDTPIPLPTNTPMPQLPANRIQTDTPIPLPTLTPSLEASATPQNTALPIATNTPRPTLPPRPANCDEAIAMGLTAQQAGQWSHLDRDGDGVACYGD